MKRNLALLFVALFLISFFSVSVNATQVPENVVVVTYELTEEGVVESTRYNENGSESSMTRIITFDGVSRLYHNGVLLSERGDVNYDAFVALIGRTFILSQNDYSLAPAYEVYGCRQEMYIHQYVNVESFVIYEEGMETSMTFVELLAAFVGIPLPWIYDVATNIYDISVNVSDPPDRMNVTVRNYMLKDPVTNAFIQNCHHYLMLCL